MNFLPKLKILSFKAPLDKLCLGRRNNLNFIRFFAATLVILGHSTGLATLKGTLDLVAQFSHGVFAAGPFGLDIFFFVSGFLVAQSYVRTNKVLPFVEARILRIFPGLIAASIFTVFLCGFATTLPISDYLRSPDVWEYVKGNSQLAIHFTLPGVFENNPFPGMVNGSLWTLPLEFHMYMLLGMFGILGFLRAGMIFNIAIFVCIIAYMQKQVFWDLTAGGVESMESPVSYFILGVFCFVHKRKIILSIPIALFVLLVARLAVHGNWTNSIWVLRFAVAYLLLVIAYLPNLIFDFFNKIGDYSYGLYIYAFLIQQFLVDRFHLQGLGTGGVLIFFTASFTLTFILAFASWHLIEKRFLTLKGKLSGFVDRYYQSSIEKIF